MPSRYIPSMRAVLPLRAFSCSLPSLFPVLPASPSIWMGRIFFRHSPSEFRTHSFYRPPALRVGFFVFSFDLAAFVTRRTGSVGAVPSAHFIFSSILSLIQCSSHHSMGFTNTPWTSMAKWRWSPPAIPVAPVRPRMSPFFTSFLTSVSMRLKWEYMLNSPHPRSIKTVWPYMPIGPANTTIPELAAGTGLWSKEARSTPSGSAGPPLGRRNSRCGPEQKRP